MEYFKHDINASEDDKILDLLEQGGYELLGYYWRFIEYLYGRGGKVSKDKLNGIAWYLHMDVDKLSTVICNFGLFCEDDEYIYSKRVVEEIEGFESVGKRMSEIGKAGGKASVQAKAKRVLEESQANAQPCDNRTLNHTSSECLTESQACAQQKRINKIKENKIKERESNGADAPSTTPTHKNVFGSFKNVFLTDDELEKLKAEYPSAYNSKIERLSQYMYQSGKSYKDHYLIIVKWIQEDEKSDNANFNVDEFYESALKKSQEIIKNCVDNKKI